MRPQHFALLVALVTNPVVGIVVLSPAPLVAQANLSKAQIAAIAEKITVLIQTPGGSGSGVLVAKEGDSYRVLTAWHVVESIKAGEEADITTPDGKTHRLDNSSIQRLPQVDMAVVSFRSGENYTLAKLGNDLAVKRGMEVYVAGFSLPGHAISKPVLQFTDGTVTASSETLLADGYALNYTNNTLPGMSGGPVLNQRGEVVGIHGRPEGRYQRTGQENVALKSGFNLAVPIRAYTAWVNKTPLPTTNVAKTGEQFFILGNRKYERGDFQGAIADYTQAIRIDPNYADAYYNRGKAKSELKDYQGAIADYTQAIRINPNDAAAYNNRGIAKDELKDYQGAIADYTQAIRIDPNFALAYYNRGNAKIELEDYQGAIEDYTQAIRINPNDAKAYNNRGFAKDELKDYQGAIEDYTQAIRINPNDAVAYYNRGNAKIELEDYQGAIEDYTQAIRINPNYAAAYNNRGRAKSELKDYQGAIEDHTQAIRINPNHARAYLARGLTKISASDRSGGCADISRAISLGDRLVSLVASATYQEFCR